MYEFKISKDEDVIKVAILMSLLSIARYKTDEEFFTLIIKAVGLERWDKFLDYMDSLLVLAQKLEASKKVVNIQNWRRTKK